MLKTLIIATVLLPKLGIAQQFTTTATEAAQPMVPRGWMGERLPQLRLNDGPSRERPRRHGQLRRDGSNGIDGDLRTSAIDCAASRAWSTFWAIRSK